jgi:thiazole synthase ThiGH ThiG subunit
VQQLCLWFTDWFRTRFNNLENIQIIIENANVPVIVDAGIGHLVKQLKLWKLELMEFY